MKKKIYIVLFVAWVIFLIQLPSIVKNIAVNKLEETIGRKVSSGNFRYNYLRNILSIEDLKIYEKNGKDIFIKFDSFDVNIDILPLLKRKIYIENLNLINPTLRLKYDDGIANFDSILKKIDSDNKKVEIENERVDDSFIKSIEFKNITIDNFTFYYNDKVVRGENKFTIKTPQILYKNKNFIFNSRIDFYNKGQVNFNLEYKKDGTLSGKLETKEFLLDDKLYIIKSLYNLKEIKGRVDSSFDFNFNFLKDIYNLEGQFNINQLKMNSVELGKLFSIDHLEGKIESVKINENKFFLNEVKTNNGTVNIESIRKYMSSISKILNKKTNGNSEEIEKLSYPIFNIKALQISRYNIYDKDLNLEIDNLKVNDLGTLKGTSKVEFTGKFQNSKMTLTGEIEKEKNIKKEQNIDSIKIKGDLNIISFNLKGVSPFLQEGLELNGNLDVSSKFNYSINNLQIKNSVVLKKLSLKKDDFDLKFGNLQFNNKFLKDSNNYKISGTIDAQNGSFNMFGIDLILKNGAIEIEEFSEDKIKLGVIKLQSPWMKMNSKESQNS
ncbi:MAG: hypothetical protein WBG30_14860, partial [Psychrilyobacter sp.]|uniref:DUF748 domain-containing protein n=1 Tax=Psychrilyobacter sp. TaxID=2586924 RepID=UPI003C7391C3